jgi:hypothetical protein
MSSPRKEEFTAIVPDRQRHLLPIQEISETGCYVELTTGRLIRVTPNMLTVGGTVFQGFSAAQPWLVGKISNNPHLPIDEARITAANASLTVNF